MRIIDVCGRLVITVRSRMGEQPVWDGRDDHGLHVEPGIYLYEQRSVGERQRGKIVIVR